MRDSELADAIERGLMWLGGGFALALMVFGGLFIAHRWLHII